MPSLPTTSTPLPWTRPMCTTWTPWRGGAGGLRRGREPHRPHLRGQHRQRRGGGRGRRGLPPGDGGENALTAYYLQLDETGLYFDPAAPFDTATLTGEHTFTGTDYPCQITFTPGTPAASLTLSYLDGTQTVTAEETLDPADLTDGQTLAVPAGTASVLLTPLRRRGATPSEPDGDPGGPLRRGLLRRRRPGAGQQGPPLRLGPGGEGSGSPATTAQQTWKGPQAAQRLRVLFEERGSLPDRRRVGPVGSPRWGRGPLLSVGGPFWTGAGWALRGFPGPGRGSGGVLRTLRVVGAFPVPRDAAPRRGPHFSREMGRRGEGASPLDPRFYGPLVPTRSFWRGGAHCSGRGASTVPMYVP